tara:strand:- start:361 stop:573 length:213 start_codon:yes stop_codon:yes gene_type:complete
VLGKPEVDLERELIFNKYETNGAGERIAWRDWRVIVENQFREPVFETEFFKVTVQEFTLSLTERFKKKRN